jgi:hypothetical protein
MRSEPPRVLPKPLIGLEPPHLTFEPLVGRARVFELARALGPHSPLEHRSGVATWLVGMKQKASLRSKLAAYIQCK